MQISPILLLLFFYKNMNFIYTSVTTLLRTSPSLSYLFSLQNANFFLFLPRSSFYIYIFCIILLMMLALSEPVVNRFAGRRKSVFAEQYDPEEDDEENNKVIFPKTDEQRTRLSDSVKNILLFRAIDPEQVSAIIQEPLLLELIRFQM